MHLPDVVTVDALHRCAPAALLAFHLAQLFLGGGFGVRHCRCGPASGCGSAANPRRP